MTHRYIAQELVGFEYMGDLWCRREMVSLKLNYFKTTKNKNNCCLESIA